MLTNSSILTQPENNAADRQISMITVVTNDKGLQSVHSDNISTAEPCNHFTVV